MELPDKGSRLTPPPAKRMGGIKAHGEDGRKSGGQAMMRGDGVEPMRGLVITPEGFGSWGISAHTPSDAGQPRSDVHLVEGQTPSPIAPRG